MSEANKNLPEAKKENAVTTRRIKQQETKSDRFIKFAKRFFAQFGTAIMAVSIVAYVFLQLMLNVSVSLDRETATYVNITDRAELSAFLFRDEFLIPQGAEGTDCFLAEDGEKVRLGQDIVITYSDENDVKLQKRISESYRLGFDVIAIPQKSDKTRLKIPKGVSIIDVRSVYDALSLFKEN